MRVPHVSSYYELTAIPMTIRATSVAAVFLGVCALVGCATPQALEVTGVSGSKYSVIGSGVLTAGNGDRAFVVKYRAPVTDVSRVFSDARDLAPVFQDEVLRLKCRGLVITAVEDVWRLGGISKSKTYAVVFMLNADGSWTELQPK